MKKSEEQAFQRNAFQCPTIFTVFNCILLDSCAFLQCPFGQHCATKDGYPNCNCNISCSGMLTEPVCGEVNSKHYGNECELRKEECKTGRRIGISITPCRGELSISLIIN